MIYLVTRNQELFDNDLYKIINVEKSLRLLKEMKMIQFDTETLELDPHLGKLLTAQFGNEALDTQIVVDCLTIDIRRYKEPLETKYIIGQNLAFDLQWLFNYDIKPRFVYDTMIVEQYIHLATPKGMYPNSLKAIGERYLGIDIDKSIRGQIQYLGLVPSVIKYAADDVKPLEAIMHKQVAILKERGDLLAAQIECNFTICNAYYMWCGVKLNEPRWRQKMLKDQKAMDEALAKLNGYVVEWDKTQPHNTLDLQEIQVQKTGLRYPISETETKKLTKLKRQGYKLLKERERPGVDVYGKRIYSRYVIKTAGDLFSNEETTACSINWQSTDQLIPLFKALGFNTKGFNKQKKEETESVEAKLLKKQKGINDEFLNIYLTYTEAAKVCSTYGQQYINAVNPITGRIHTQFRALGTDTGRLACGSKKINTALAKLKGLPTKEVQGRTDLICAYPQLQNLPNDAETRACFIAEEGNDWVSIDYNSEESRLLASLSNDKAMLEVFELGQDMHSKVAYMIYPELIPRDTDIKDIKKKYHDLRQKAKGPEFTFAFLGNWATLVANYGMSKEEAQAIENNYKKGFYGATAFQEQCKKFIENNGYVIICEETGHRAYWWDWQEWYDRQHSKEFWDKYRYYKDNDIDLPEIYSTHFKARAKWDKNGVNSRTQGLGAVIFKIFNANLFWWIVDNNLFGKVKFCVPVHDEIDLECPKELTEQVVEVTKKFMQEAGEMFCHRLPMPAEEEVGAYWKH